jgi:ABC-type multidrug transport system fused ATPase/permease subunit
MKRALTAAQNRIMGVILILLYAILAGLAGRWWNNVINNYNFGNGNYNNMLMTFLFILTILSICANVAWAIGMLLAPHHTFKDLAALSAISGLILCTVFAKYHRTGFNDIGNRKLLMAYEAFAIIDGVLSLILGMIYLLMPTVHEDKIYNTGHRSSDPAPVTT